MITNNLKKNSFKNIYKKRKNLLLVYLFFAFIFAFSQTFSKEDNILFFFKPMLLPLLGIYYLDKTKKKFKFIFLVLLFLFYVGELILVINEPNTYYIMLVFFLVPYFLMVWQLFQFEKNNPIEKNQNINLFVYAVITMFLVYLSYTIIDNVINISTVKLVIYILYSISLILLMLFATYKFLSTTDNYNVYLLLAVLCFIVADSFFCFKTDFLMDGTVDFVQVLTKLLGYFFYTNYSILIEKKSN